LNQVHVEEGAPAVWEEPERYPGLLANLTGIVVRDRFPDSFLTVHRALFAARHDHSMDTRKREVIEQVLGESGVDAAAVLSEVDDGWPLEALRKEHTFDVDEHKAFGVPTFIAGDRAVFVRLMNRPGDDAAGAVATINRVLDLVTGWPELNEFKTTTILR
jgi:plasmid stability protein